MKEQVSQTKKGSVLRTSMYVAVLIGLAAFLIFPFLQQSLLEMQICH